MCIISHRTGCGIVTQSPQKCANQKHPMGASRSALKANWCELRKAVLTSTADPTSTVRKTLTLCTLIRRVRCHYAIQRQPAKQRPRHRVRQCSLLPRPTPLRHRGLEAMIEFCISSCSRFGSRTLKAYDARPTEHHEIKAVHSCERTTPRQTLHQKERTSCQMHTRAMLR